MSTYKSRAKDQRTAEEIGISQDLMCSAQGCPHRWSVDAGTGRLCSWHAWIPPHRWPQITQEQLDAVADRAHRAQAVPALQKPLTRAQQTAILQSLRNFEPQSPNSGWAARIVDRHEAGEVISPLVVKMARFVAGRRAVVKEPA